MQIVSESKASPQATLIYSPPGVGKTEFAAYYPDPIFLMIDLETGLRTLIDSGRVPADTAHMKEPLYHFDDVIKAIDFVADTQHNHQTLVIDTFNSLELLLKRKVTNDQFYRREDKFDAFAKGWERCLNPWNMMLHRLNNVRARGMRVVVLAHSEVSQIRNPDGEDYQSHTPLLNKKVLWVPTNAWFDNVLFMNLEVCSVTDKTQQAVKDKNHRLLYVQADAGHFAKNRFGLMHPVSMGTCGEEGFHNFQKAVKDARASKAPKDLPRGKKPPTAETKSPPAETKQGSAETAAPTGPAWVQTWHQRIRAAGKIGPAVSTFGDLASDYASAPEPDQIEHFPGLFMAWLEHCLGLGDKAAEQVHKKVTGKHDVPASVVGPLLARLEQAKA